MPQNMKKSKKKKFVITFQILAAFTIGLILLFRLSTYHPKPVMEENVHFRSLSDATGV